MKKYNKSEIAKIVLKTILAVGLVTIALVAPNVAQIFKYFKPKDFNERRRVKQSLSRLQKRGLIKQKGAMDGYFVLTAKGKAKAMRYQVETMKIPRQRKWDKKWRLVMFDVPEEKKRARQAINYALKKIGCVQYQKSVFITPFPCEKEVDFVGETFDVRSYMRIVFAEQIEKSGEFERKFDL
ncbi:MAG: hypothetical protein AAB821_01605 [Patescibacteria group bacterium]